jgi:hypothetical protein
MKTKILVNLFVFSTLILSAYGFANTQMETSPQTKTGTVEETQTPNEDSELLEQFSVICLTNNSNANVGFQWTDNAPHNMVLAPSQWQSYSWNDGGSHSITVMYDADTTSGSVWKTYRLYSAPAQFPDCQYGNRYHFSNVTDRWIELYSGLRP